MTEVVTWGSGGTPKATESQYYDNGDIPWLIIGDLNDGVVTESQSKITELGLKNSSAKIIPAGTLLVAMYGSIGKLGITGIECCTNQAIAFAKELRGVSTKYMFYYMAMMKSKLISMGKGGTQNNISQTILKSLNVIVPPPEVQDNLVFRIEELFSELDKAVETLQTTKQQLAVYRQAVKLNKVSIRYGDRTILKELDWTVHRGEKWALSGENGAGKSTLLSLVCADNPQSYACDISLFGRKRGTGESIWEIKKHIGYVSPEMHRAYLKNLPAIEIVASGLHDSIGLYRRPQPEQMDICEWWMDVFGIAALKDKAFLQLSSGEQRLALLARAFVKDPELLILDEPLHGLDTYNRRRVKKVIEAFCQRKDKTMIMVTHYESELPGTITDRIFLKRN